MTRQELIEQILEKKSFLCIGLDPDLSRIPSHLGNGYDAVKKFNAAIIEETHDLAVAYKPNLAFFEVGGQPGWAALEHAVQLVPGNCLSIADAKRGDIGNTASAYARSLFEGLGADAATVAPYMGEDSIMPFLDFQGKWTVLLALTSNPGANDFQLMEDNDGRPLYQKVLRKACSWGNPDNLMFVAGATRPEYLRQIREIAKEHFLLVPGIGAQGGDLGEVFRHGAIQDVGLLVNSSRSILYASSGKDFAKAARREALKLQREMESLLESQLR